MKSPWREQRGVMLTYRRESDKLQWGRVYKARGNIPVKVKSSELSYPKALKVIAS